MARSFVRASDQYFTRGAVITGLPATFACWFWPDSIATDNTAYSLVTSGSGSSNFLRLGIYQGKLIGQHNQIAGMAQISTNVSQSTWQFGVATFTSTTKRDVYLNGSSTTATNGGTMATVTHSTFRIGSRVTTGEPWQGHLAHVGVWNVALSTIEIDELYNNGIGADPRSVRPDALVAYYPLLNDDGATDYVGDYALTATNSPGFAQHPPVLMRSRPRLVLPFSVGASTATLDKTLGSLSCSSASQTTSFADGGNQTLAALTSAATAQQTSFGVTSHALAAATGVASAKTTSFAASSPSLASLTSAAISQQTSFAATNSALGNVTCSSAATLGDAQNAATNAMLSPLTSTAAAQTTSFANGGNQTLGTLTSTATAQSGSFAATSQTLANATSSGQASLGSYAASMATLANATLLAAVGSPETLALATWVRNAMLDAIDATIGENAVLRLRDGSTPANCAAADTGSTLATLALPSNWLAAATGGAAQMAGQWEDADCDDTGTASYWRIYDAMGTCHVQGSVSVAGGGGDMILNDLAAQPGKALTVNTFVATEGHG